jgi:prolipoprotein diacylglyceryltransferase
LAFAYEGGNLPGFDCATTAGTCTGTLDAGQVLTITHQNATLTSASGEILSTGVGVHQTALYDMIFATLLFLLLYGLSRKPRRLGILTLTFGAIYGATRVLEDNLRVDKQVFGLTGSQWTGLTVSIFCIVTLIVWAIRARSRSPGGRESAEV